MRSCPRIDVPSRADSVIAFSHGPVLHYGTDGPYYSTNSAYYSTDDSYYSTNGAYYSTDGAYYKTGGSSYVRGGGAHRAARTRGTGVSAGFAGCPRNRRGLEKTPRFLPAAPSFGVHTVCSSWKRLKIP
jgi:hypothetical protein